MSDYRFRFLVLALVACTAIISLSFSSRTANPLPDGNVTWLGTWDTHYGGKLHHPVVFKRIEEGKLRGEYAFRGTYGGWVEGHITVSEYNDKELKGWWWQTQDGNYDDEGNVTFTRTSPTAFTGTYTRKRDKHSRTYTWSGKRPARD